MASGWPPFTALNISKVPTIAASGKGWNWSIPSEISFTLAQYFWNAL
jgi:hypothetical protein